MNGISLRKVIENKISGHLSLVVIGNAASSVIGALAVLIISRQLTVSDFGLFNTALYALLMISPLTDLGTSRSVVMFSSALLRDQKHEQATKLMNFAFLLRFLVSLVVGLMLFIGSPYLSTRIFDISGMDLLFKLVAVWIVIRSLFLFVRIVFQTYQEFNKSVVMQIIVDVSRLTFVVIAGIVTKLNSVIAILIFIAASLFGLIYGVLRINKESILRFKWPEINLSEVFSFSKWIFLNNIVVNVMSSIPIFIILELLGTFSAGIYGLAISINFVFPILIQSLGTVFLPEISRFREINQYKSLFKITVFVLILFLVLSIPVILASKSIIRILFGIRYIDAVPVFNLLLLGNVFRLGGSLIRISLLPLNKPHITAYINILSIIILVSGCFLLIPVIGVVAPAVIFLATNIVAFVFLLFYVYKILAKDKLKTIDSNLGSSDSSQLD